MYRTIIKYNPKVVTPEMFPIVAYDPGTTIGVAWASLTHCDSDGLYTVEVNTYTLTWPTLGAVLDIENNAATASRITAEEFAIYAHKAQALSWDKVPAARVLGYIEAMALKYDKPMTSYMAARAKGLATDDFMKDKQMGGKWVRNRHQRDALRHLWVELVQLPKIGETDG